MAEAAQGTQQEFWRPPSPVIAPEILDNPSAPAMAEVCQGCSTEFLLGAQFCHACGGRRPLVSSLERVGSVGASRVWDGFAKQVRQIWEGIGLNRIHFPEITNVRAPGWLHYLHFHEIRTRIGLSTASLVAFVLGLVCVSGALLVGLLTAKTLVDWQAIQMYRIEWLLAATAAFVAGILLKKTDRDEQD